MASTPNRQTALAAGPISAPADAPAIRKKEELADEHGALRFALRLEIDEGNDDAHGTRNNGGDVEIGLPAHIVVYAHCTPPCQF